MSLRIPRRQYADLYGPTVGDRVRLADTDLLIRIERDLTTPGERRSSAAARSSATAWASRRGDAREATLDTVITNAVIIDHWGIVKADIGIRDGRIVAVGKAGNPDLMAGVSPDMVIGAGHGSHRRRRQDRHRGRARQPHPLHLPAGRDRGRSAPG
jgi:urease subunit alpha